MEQCIQVVLELRLLKITELFSEPVANLLLLISGLISAILLVFYIRILRVTRQIHHLIYVVYDIRDSSKNLFTGSKEECIDYIDNQIGEKDEDIVTWRNLRCIKYFDKKSNRISVSQYYF
jgi:hypothetical protein